MLLDVSTIPARRRPNACFACPASWARPDADIRTPVFDVSVDRLREAVVAIAAAEPRTNLITLDRDARQAEFEQRSRLFGFPDRITVCFEAIPEGGSTLAIFSRARLGYYDFGVNHRRVRRWLVALGAELGERHAAEPE